MKNIKKDFPWFANNSNYTYMDSAATSLKPKIVIDEISKYYEKYGTNPHNSDSSLSMETLKIIEEARKNVANLFNCSSKNIIFNSGATEGINLIANHFKKILKKNDEIILSYSEHSSNMLPWIELAKETSSKIVWIGDKNHFPNQDFFLKVINKNTKIITFALISNLFGYEINEDLINKIKTKNPKIVCVVDAAQSIPHKKLDTKKNNVDFAVCSAHKMLGPTGMGCIYIKDEWIEKLTPNKLGGSMNSEVCENNYLPSSGISKFEGGSPNTSGIFGWNAAIKYLNDYGYENIEKHGIELKKYFESKVSQIKNLKYYKSNSNAPIFAINFDGVHPQDLASYLSNNKIIVRSGLSCAKLTPKITSLDGVVRISLYIYNDKEDIDKLIDSLKRYKKGDELNAIIW